MRSSIPGGTPVLLRVTVDNGSVTISIGIAATGSRSEVAARVRPFTGRTGALRPAAPGVGLGLSGGAGSLVLSAALTVQSRPGEGSRFDLTLSTRFRQAGLPVRSFHAANSGPLTRQLARRHECAAERYPFETTSCRRFGRTPVRDLKSRLPIICLAGRRLRAERENRRRNTPRPPRSNGKGPLQGARRMDRSGGREVPLPDHCPRQRRSRAGFCRYSATQAVRPSQKGTRSKGQSWCGRPPSFRPTSPRRRRREV